MSTNPPDRVRRAPPPVTLPSAPADAAAAAHSELSRRAADLARIADEAWEDCTKDVDIEGELAARRNASGQ